MEKMENQVIEEVLVKDSEKSLSDDKSVNRSITIKSNNKRKRVDLVSYFKSKSDAYIFALLHTARVTRNDILGLEKAHFGNKKLAAKVRDEVIAELEKSDSEEKDMAIKAMKDLYKGLVC